MNQAAVEGILAQITKLPDEERALLEKRLGQMLEGEWQKGADKARRQARKQGLDQASIDRAVRQVRRSR